MQIMLMNSITHIHDLMCCDGVFDDDDEIDAVLCNIVSKYIDLSLYMHYVLTYALGCRCLHMTEGMFVR